MMTDMKARAMARKQLAKEIVEFAARASGAMVTAGARPVLAIQCDVLFAEIAGQLHVPTSTIDKWASEALEVNDDDRQD